MHFAFADIVIPLCNKTLVLTEYFIHVVRDVLHEVLSTEPSFSFHIHSVWHWGPPSLLYNGYQVFPRDKAARVWH
jgi:hypothetical protein